MVSHQSNYTPININKLLYKKYSKTKEEYNLMKINSIFMDKHSSLNLKYKECLIQDYHEEFLKKFYNIFESGEKLSKLFKYYKNYLIFFCKPFLNNLPENKIIQKHCEDHAEIFYTINYKKKIEPENNLKKNLTRNFAQEKIEVLFDTKVRESIANAKKINESTEETIEKICKSIKEKTNSNLENKLQLDSRKNRTGSSEVYESDDLTKKLRNFSKLNFKSKNDKKSNNINIACSNFANKKKNCIIESEKGKLEHLIVKHNNKNIFPDKLMLKKNSNEYARVISQDKLPLSKINFDKNSIQSKYTSSDNKSFGKSFKYFSDSNRNPLDKKNILSPDRKISIDKSSNNSQNQNQNKNFPKNINPNQFRLNNKIKNCLNSSVINEALSKEKSTLYKSKNTSASQFNIFKNSNSSRLFLNQIENIKTKKLSIIHHENIQKPSYIKPLIENKTKNHNPKRISDNKIKKLTSNTHNNIFTQNHNPNNFHTNVMSYHIFNKNNFNKLTSRDSRIKKSTYEIYKENINCSSIKNKTIPIKHNVKTQRYYSLIQQSSQKIL